MLTAWAAPLKAENEAVMKQGLMGAVTGGLFEQSHLRGSSHFASKATIVAHRIIKVNLCWAD